MEFFFLLIFLSFIKYNNSTNQTIFENDSGILILNDNNMKYAIEYYNYLLVLFYFPWNRKYDYIIPELIKANYIIEEKGLPYKIGKVDLLINEVMREKNSFIFYPTYIFFINGQKSVYLDQFKNYTEILNYFNNKIIGFALNKINPDEIEKIKKENKIIVLSTLNNETYKKENLIIKNISENSIYESYVKFIFCPSEKCISRYKKGIFLITKFKKEKIISYNYKNMTYDLFDEFLCNNTHEQGQLITAFDFQKILKINKTTLLYFKNSTRANLTYRERLFETIGNEYKDLMFSFIVDAKGNNLYKRLRQIFTIDIIPACILFAPIERKKYQLNTDINEENIRKFIYIFFLNDYDSIRSEEIPKNQFYSYKIIVGKNFKNEVIMKNKNIIILFYNSSKLKLLNNELKTFKKISEQFFNYTNFEFAAMDVLHNEVKSINFKSIPSVYLYFAKDKSYPFQYDGQIQYDDLVKWVQYLIKLDKEK
jgi:hypothetical protein